MFVAVVKVIELNCKVFVEARSRGQANYALCWINNLVAGLNEKLLERQISYF